MLESRPQQLLPESSRSKGTNASGASSSSIGVQHRRILDKVWNAVEHVMGEMKEILFAQLRDPSRTVEEQEKTIECVPKYIYAFPCSNFSL